MKNVYFAAALAMLAFSACSDDKVDDSSKDGACYTKIRMFDDTEYEGSDSCTEGISQSITEDDCNEAQEILDEYYPEYGADVTFMNSCPSGYKYKCKERDGRVSVYNYYYGPVTDNMKSCPK